MYQNGNLSVKKELKDEYYEYVRTTYFVNRNKYIRIRNYNNTKTYHRWFENEILEVEYNGESDYIYYNEKGVKITPYRTQVSINFTQKKEKIELTQEIKHEKNRNN